MTEQNTASNQSTSSLTPPPNAIILGDGVYLPAPYYDNTPFSKNALTVDDVGSGKSRYFVQPNFLQFSGNTLVIGNAGSGKSRCYIQPNLLQFNSNFVVADYNGEHVRRYGGILRDAGYEVQIFSATGGNVTVENLDGSTQDIPSLVFNPLQYIETDEDVQFIAETLLHSKKKNPTLQLLLTALIDYVDTMCDSEIKTFYYIKELLRASVPSDKTKRFSVEFMSKLSSFCSEHPGNIGAKAFTELSNNASTRTIRRIVLELLQFLEELFPKKLVDTAQAVNHLNELDLSAFRNKKKALFVVISPLSCSGMCSLLLNQVFNVCLTPGFSEPVHFILDEFPGLHLKDIRNQLTCAHNYNATFSVVLQTLTQVNEDIRDYLLANCKNLLCLGTFDHDTAEFLSKRSGLKAVPNSFCGTRSAPFFSPEEILTQDASEAIVFPRSKDPIVCKKYRIESHPNYINGL